MLIGESHYFPQEPYKDGMTSTRQHLDANTWYQGNVTTLTPDERKWIDPTGIITRSSEKGFSNRAHSIFKNSFFEINLHGPKYSDYRGVGEVVVFYNYFLRPALFGKFLQVVNKDKQIAEEVFKLVVDKYCPGAIVFLSKLAFGTWKASAAYPASIPIVATPHPGCAHWNRLSYGGKKGKEILGEFIKHIWHSAVEDQRLDPH
ncbi:MAG TPA: hypothetical protein VHR66_20835 [Gemmataceae bacterium]|nr:hypothetical protein [Gemmataceae bacterium]